MKKVFALVLAFAFCANGIAFAADDGVIKVGVISPLTGGVAVYGTAAKNGVELYTTLFNQRGGVNGRKIELVIYDDRGDPTEALNAYNKLVTADEVVAFIGPATSGATFGVAEASTADNVPGITATATHPDVTKYGNHYFRTCYEDPFQGGTMARFAHEKLNAKTAAILYNVSDAHSTGLYNAFSASAAEVGFEIVATEGYATDDVDFNSQLINITNAAPDVIFLPDYYNRMYMIISQARQAGITSTFLGVAGTDGILEIEGADHSVLNNLYFATHYFVGDPSQLVQDFVKDYEAEHGAKPISFAALGYDAAAVLFDALIKVDTDEVKLGPTPESYQAIIDKMAATNIEGVTGQITFVDNNPVKDVTILKIQDSAYVFETKYK